MENEQQHELISLGIMGGGETIEPLKTEAQEGVDDTEDVDPLGGNEATFHTEVMPSTVDNGGQSMNEQTTDAVLDDPLTDRSGNEDPLESLFTERTDSSLDNEHEDMKVEETDDGHVDDLEVATDREVECSGVNENKDEEAIRHMDQCVLDEKIPAALSQPDFGVNQLGSPTKPGPPTRPPRPHSLSFASSIPALSPPTTYPIEPQSELASPPHIVAFDVGGTLFRCKASLIGKYPSKKLNIIIQCGCDQLDRNTFFIDRNPQHFQIILDWYRTGKYIRHPMVNEQAFKEDAAYFDLLEEFFPSQSTIHPLPISVPVSEVASVPTTLPQLSDRTKLSSIQSPSSPLITSPTSVNKSQVRDRYESPSHHRHTRNDGVLRFSKRQMSTLTEQGNPLVWAARTYEHLVVESVKGNGKLFVRVCDATGMNILLVERAVLYDSRSWFYLHDGRAKLPNCVLPGNHMYTFWMESHDDTTTLTKSPKKMSGKNKGSAVGLEVEFRSIFTFAADEDVLDMDDELQNILKTKGGAWNKEGQGTGGDKGGSAVNKPGRCLFLPPHYIESPQIQVTPAQSGMLVNDRMDNERDAISEQILAQAKMKPTGNSAVPKSIDVVSTLTAPNKGSTGTSLNVVAPSSVIKRNGAAIATTSSGYGNTSSITAKSHGGEKVIVYGQDATALLNPTPPISQSPPAKSMKTGKYSESQALQFKR